VQKLSIILSISILAFSMSLQAADPVTTYKYDARGRLIQVADDSNKQINYAYDEAGNRVSVADHEVSAATQPVITSFIAPNSVASYGANATISWATTDAVYCALGIFNDYSNYPNLPTTGSQTIKIFENTGVTVVCYNGTLSASAGKIIKLNRGPTGGVLN